jgi:hypothetical protein
MLRGVARVNGRVTMTGTMTFSLGDAKPRAGEDSGTNS